MCVCNPTSFKNLNTSFPVIFRVDATTVCFPSLIPEQRPQPVHLAFRDISYSIVNRHILQGVDGLIRPGQILAVMGPSGCGKTTLLNTLSGRLKLDSGQIYLNRYYFTSEELFKVIFKAVNY